MSKNTTARLRHTAIASLLLLAFGPAAAEPEKADPDVIRRDLATPDSQIEVGVGSLTGKSRRFGEFRGLDSEGTYGLFNLDLIQRDDASGTWLRLKGKNLGLETRELRLDHEKQGDWGVFLEAGRLTRHEPWIVNTGLSGIGTGSQTVSGVAPRRNLDLGIERDSVGMGARKYLLGGFDIRVSFKQEEKRGDRMYGRGSGSATANSGTIEFLAEPLDRTTRQWEVVAGYADRKLQLSGGYSGSSFENRIPMLSITGGGAGLPAQEVLPPSNEAHQLHLAGGYNFSDTTRTSFKLSHSLALQDTLFALPAAASTGRKSLDGRQVTTLAFADLTLRPADRLDLSANVRFEDRDDRTPLASYLTPSLPTSTSCVATPANCLGLNSAGLSAFNKPTSLTQLKGMVEAGYQLDDGYRLVGTLEQEQIHRSVPAPYRRVAFREKTDETLVRLEIRRSLSETLNGSLAYVHSDRGGSDYIDDTYGQNALGVVAVAGAPTNQVNPLIWADRRRDKLRLTADWVPEESWSAQFIGDVSSDLYGGRNMGPRKGTGMFVSADVTYAINASWKISGWLSRERVTADQITHTDYSTADNPVANRGVVWEAGIRNVTTAWGLSLKGKPSERLELGADLSSSTDTAEHGMTRLGSIGTPTPANALYGTASPTSLPDYYYRQLSLKLFADYALARNSGIRGSFQFDHVRTNDWTWDNFTYNNSALTVTDGTTVSQPRLQNSTFVGATYYYRWR